MAHLLVATFLFGALLALAAAIDARTRRIPDWLNAAIAATGLAAAWLIGLDLIARLAGVLAGFAAIYAVNFFYRRARGRDGIGLGDAKLLGASGAWVGWMGLPFALLIASAAGLAFVALQRLRGRTLGGADMLAFGPFLALGALTVWCVQNFV